MALEQEITGSDGVTCAYHRVLCWTVDAENGRVQVAYGSYLDAKARADYPQPVRRDSVALEISDPIVTGGAPEIYTALKLSRFKDATDV